MAHPLLDRQLRTLGLTADVPPTPERWTELLERIGATYSTRDRLGAVFQSLSDGVCVLDRELRCQLLNPAAERLLGVTSDAARGRPLDEFVGGIDVVSRTWKGSACVEDTRLERKDGRSIPIALVAVPVWDEGLVQGIALVMRDISGRLQLERELQQARKLEAVGRLAAGLAHEVNTPVQFASDSLSFVRAAVDELRRVVEGYRAANRSILEGAPSAAAAHDAARLEQETGLDELLSSLPVAITRAEEGLDRIAAIVRSVKEFAHPDRGAMAPVDFARAVRAALEIARVETQDVAEVVTDLAELPPVTCDPVAIDQVVLNLVVNAAHAIGDVVREQGGKGRIRVGTRREGDDVVLFVEDTGTGIPATVRERVFDPFFTTKEVGKGTGQGLAIARSLVVDRHGGELTFETQEGAGTTFFVRLPIAGRREALVA